MQDSFLDFSQGQIGNSGNNLYITHSGEIKTINRFDLNQDGFIDLIFNSTHDRMHYNPPTLAGVNSQGLVTAQSLDILDSKAAVVEDFNRDGYSDIAFLPFPSNGQSERCYLSINYGDQHGWFNSKTPRPLPLSAPTAIATADLNLDDWPDLVVAQTKTYQPEQPVLRVYWGSEDGFKVDTYAEFLTDEVVGIARGEFDGNGREDIAFLTAKSELNILYAVEIAELDTIWSPVGYSLSEAGNTIDESLNLLDISAGKANQDDLTDLFFSSSNPKVYILKGKPGKAIGELEIINAFPATQITAGDLDEDGKAEIILTNLKFSKHTLGTGALNSGKSNPLRILWSDSLGYSSKNILELDVPNAISTAVGEFNGDGHPDLAVAVYQGDKTTESKSCFFFGSSEHKLERALDEIPTVGATQAVVIPGDENSPDKVVFTNTLKSTLKESVPILVYWGSQTGFTSENRWEIPNRSGYESSAADLNNDGHIDLIILNSGHAGPEISNSDPDLGAHVFWGSAKGITPGPNKFDLSRSTILREKNLGGSTIADLNRDGFLDIVLGAFDGEVQDTNLIIYYGSVDGFTTSNKKTIPVVGRSISPLAADINRDSWLDLTIVSLYTDSITTLYGGPEGFSFENRSKLYVQSPVDLEAADLNGDGFLDILAPSYHDKSSGINDFGNHIYWGSENGYDPTNAQWLPGTATVGPAIADLDADGYLDIFCPNYRSQGTREHIPSYLYWGSSTGFYPQQRTIIIANSAHDAQIADFNHDGQLDLAISEHSTDIGHLIESSVLYNDGKRFSDPQIIHLPTIGTHWMWQQDMGNLYNRRFEETYVSKTFDWEKAKTTGMFQTKASIPPGSSLTIEIRSAANEMSLKDATWHVINDGVFSLKREDRLLQYRLIFKSEYGDVYPEVEQIHIQIED